MSGYLEILNVGAGDIKISFDKDDPAELIRAGRMVRDMLHRGYALLVKEGERWTRVREFDESTGEYVIADFAPEEPGAPEPMRADPRGLAPKLRGEPESLADQNLDDMI